MLRLLKSTKVQKPFYHEMICVHLYSMEELCYFLETHVYLIDPTWVGEGLFSWIETELGMTDLADDLRRAHRKKADEFACAEMILRSSGNYSAGELDNLSGLLDQTRDKTMTERRKMSGDLSLSAGKYRQAAYIYMELLGEEYTMQMTEELRGNIYHNLGVVYARMFLFDEAAALFAQAYKMRKNAASRNAYFYAMNFANADSLIDEKRMDLNLNVMREDLSHLAEVRDDPEYYVERKKASIASYALEWKKAQADLLAGWQKEYRSFL